MDKKKPGTSGPTPTAPSTTGKPAPPAGSRPGQVGQADGGSGSKKKK